MSTSAATPLRDPMLHDLHARVNRLEDKQTIAIERDHQRDLQLATLTVDVKHIRDGQDKMTAGINKVLWAIALWLLTGALGGLWFLISNGLLTTFSQ